MYFIDAINYPFNDKGIWEKLIIAGLLLFIPVINIFGAIVVAGYGLRIIHHVMAGDTDLPEFSYADDFSRGFMLVVAGLIYAIPTAIIIGIFAALFSGIEGSLSVLAAVLLLMIVIFLVYFVYFVGMVRYAVSGEFSEFFRLGQNLNLITNNGSSALMLMLNLIVFSVVMGVGYFVGLMLFVIPGLAVAVLANFGQYYLFARWGLEIGLGDAYMQKRKVESF